MRSRLAPTPPCIQFIFHWTGGEAKGKAATRSHFLGMERLPDIYIVFFKCSRRTEPKHSQRCWLATNVGRDLSECASLHFFCGGIFYPLVYYEFSTGLHSSGLFVTGMLVFNAAFQQGSAPGSPFIVTVEFLVCMFFLSPPGEGAVLACAKWPTFFYLLPRILHYV